MAFHEPYSSAVYFAPPQVRIYVGGVWMDDACGVQYRVRDDKTPKYGYNDRQYRAITMGHTLVQGQLQIEFRFNGYLRHAITRWKQLNKNIKKVNERDPRVGKPRTLAEWAGQDGKLDPTYLNSAEVTEGVGRAFAASQSLGVDAAAQAKMTWWRKFNPKREGPANDMRDPQNNPYLSEAQLIRALIDQKLWRPGLFSSGFDLLMAFGVKDTDLASDFDPALVKVIRDVNIIGESQAIQIDVPDGSRSIREVYNFFAKEIVPGV